MCERDKRERQSASARERESERERKSARARERERERESDKWKEGVLVTFSRIRSSSGQGGWLRLTRNSQVPRKKGSKVSNRANWSNRQLRDQENHFWGDLGCSDRFSVYLVAKRCEKRCRTHSGVLTDRENKTQLHASETWRGCGFAPFRFQILRTLSPWFAYYNFKTL